MIFEAVALLLAFIHFSIPLAYYWYAKAVWLKKPWNIKADLNYTPRVTVIVPTYNEATLIQQKLDDIAAQDYPRDSLEVIVVDSASTDRTPEIAEEWARGNNLQVKVLREPVRRGKAHALNTALSHATGEVVVVSDADSTWATRDTLRRAVAVLADPSVGAVTCIKVPAGRSPGRVEETYRGYYNTLRVAESKKHSTPVFHGELAAFRRKLLDEVKAFPTYTGSDDSHTATLIALKGYRAVALEDLVCVEFLPTRGYTSWRVRRAQHLVQHFAYTLKRVPRAPRGLKPILVAEAYLHLLNPWLLLAAAILLSAAAAKGDVLAAAALSAGILLLALKPYRTWIASQLYLILGSLRNLSGKGIAWEKTAKR
ncbi:glycosyltransferase family 2 protein [Infirmifilum lucidum]|uniref:Glycosyltransferase family 2 protein n=1 Tax=Infirmifilum lucidum TaxID=2776706 RepID=A0A7L9FHN8_9CREN|nr:glycosyltransferase family 2 protein [Infirmifilum lucidum]QOJ79279.1 glycosyltransferase family 2 protein [Infirmifilum lucidum]